VLKVSHIKVTFHLTIPEGTRPRAERALAVVERGCPVAQTLKGCVQFAYDAVIHEMTSPP
jgi:organic hydroperoxide reductase OsmC/OhrA